MYLFVAYIERYFVQYIYADYCLRDLIFVIIVPVVVLVPCGARPSAGTVMTMLVLFFFAVCIVSLISIGNVISLDQITSF